MSDGKSPVNRIAVDIGNSRIKFGQFRRDTTPGAQQRGLPEPSAVFDLSIINKSGDFDVKSLGGWADSHITESTDWLIASVHRGAAERLTRVLGECAARSKAKGLIRQLTYRDVAIPIRVDAPERVGIDRLLAAAAADRLRDRDRPAIIVDLGTAITVDLVEADGAFAGGAILPGIATSARALAEQTDALPQIELEFLDKPPAALGTSTVPAIESGIYWGAIGAIRELVSQLSAPFQIRPDLFITGGASRQVADLLKSH